MAKEKDTPAKKEVQQSWDDKLAAALPQKSTYFDAVRTDAYMNQNLVANYVEFWVAMQVDKAQDKWRVMHYMVFDLDQPDGKFKSENVSKTEISFPEAVYQMAKFDETSRMMQSHQSLSLSPEQYPAEKYPELKVHYFDIEHYRVAANIEGMAFDDAGQPYRRVEGKVFADASFKRQEIAKTILAVEQARENPKVAVKIEGGILSDIFNSVSGRNASLDDILKVGKSLACMDNFALQMGAFYLGLQDVLKINDKLDKVQGLTPDEKEAVYKKSAALVPVNKATGPSLEMLLSDLLPKASQTLDDAAKIGIHTEPFRKHLAECELYTHLLRASQSRGQLMASMRSVHGTDMNAVATIQEAVRKAQDKFLDLGGTMERFDRLQAWVANDKKEMVPPWVSRWLDRYYDARQKTMKKVQERQAGTREVNTMAVKVKPPIVE